MAAPTCSVLVEQHSIRARCCFAQRGHGKRVPIIRTSGKAHVDRGCRTSRPTARAQSDLLNRCACRGGLDEEDLAIGTTEFNDAADRDACEHWAFRRHVSCLCCRPVACSDEDHRCVIGSVDAVGPAHNRIVQPGRKRDAVPRSAEVGRIPDSVRNDHCHLARIARGDQATSIRLRKAVVGEGGGGHRRPGAGVVKGSPHRWDAVSGDVEHPRLAVGEHTRDLCAVGIRVTQ